MPYLNAISTGILHINTYFLSASTQMLSIKNHGVYKLLIGCSINYQQMLYEFILLHLEIYFFLKLEYNIFYYLSQKNVWLI